MRNQRQVLYMNILVWHNKNICYNNNNNNNKYNNIIISHSIEKNDVKTHYRKLIPTHDINYIYIKTISIIN